MLAGLTLDAGDGSSGNPLHRFAIWAYIASYLAGGWHATWIALLDLRHGKANIDLLMVIAAVGSAMLGEWWEGAVLLFLFSLSHALEAFILGRTRTAIASLMELAPDEATRIRDGHEELVPVDILMPGDRIIVRPSERIAADGVVREGVSSVDQAIMTGESMPVDKQPGDGVFSGTLNQHGVLTVEVTRTAGETTLARMVKLVEQAQSERATTQQFSTWFGQRYTWVVLGLAAVSYLWFHFGTSAGLWEAFSRSMTILVVASPCAVVISIPSAILTAITAAARNGVLFKGGLHIERTASLEAMAFDKTGTLTIGKPQLVQAEPARGVSDGELLAWAAAIEAHSEHPLAEAIVRGAQVAASKCRRLSNVRAVVGSGIQGSVNGATVLVGKPEWISEVCGVPDPALQAIETARSAGQTVMAVAADTRFAGWLAVADTLRDTAAQAVNELREMGLEPLLMLSGDNARVAGHLAGQLNLNYQADLQPGDKFVILKGMMNKQRKTGMIGDGTNDAPALATATVGFTLGGAGSDVALETADVVLMSDDLRRLPYAIRLARRTTHILRQNLCLAFGVMFVLLAASLWTAVPLPQAVFGHEGSTVLVILNGLRLLSSRK